MHSSMKQAHAAPRCHYIRLNEQRCTQPALHDRIFCRFHDIMETPLPDPRLIPFVEDAATLQVALMQVIRAIQLGKMERRTAGTILYALQIAASNLKYLAAEVGHPFPLTTAQSKKKEKDDEELPGPSLAEILIDRLDQLLEKPPDADEDAEEEEDCEATSAPGHVGNQKSKFENHKSADRAGGVPAVPQNSDFHAIVLSSCSPPARREAEACEPASVETNTKNPEPKTQSLIDTLHACVPSQIKQSKFEKSSRLPDFPSPQSRPSATIVPDASADHRPLYGPSRAGTRRDGRRVRS